MPCRPLIAASLLAVLALPGCNRGQVSLGLIGKPAPALAVAGRPLQALKGRVVVLNFWASWCGPCLVEFPSLEALQRQMPGLTVLAVSFDTSQSAYETFLARHRVDLRTALDMSGRSNHAYGTTRPPETWIIDRQGTVRRRFIGAQDWTSPEIEDYLRALE